MPKYRVDVYWTMYGCAIVEAENPTAAEYIVDNQLDLQDFDGVYVDGSFDVAEMEEVED